ARLAHVVRGDVATRGPPVVPPSGLEAVARRPGRARAPRERPVPRRAAPLHPGIALSLPLRSSRRSQRRLVDPRARRDVASAALGGRQSAAALPAVARVAR